jgi:alkanesulfonate monooxygenase SsuD/methylene tetrahydromethanopterin reductase-like flavin-dependent oxidoreductase (luciferase family)
MYPFTLQFDMRAPDFGTPAKELYAAALDMATYVDAQGIKLSVQEHHCSPDNYLPTPFVMAAAFAARTKRSRIQLAAVLLPLHDPVEIAEQMAVLDLVSNGRLEVAFGTGYVKSEFAMFQVSPQDRGRLMDEGIPIIIRSLAGDRFIAGGREIFVRPLSVQKPHPIIYAAGGVPATAKRAARFGIGLYPLNRDIIPIYYDECRKVGRPPGKVTFGSGVIHVSEDPEATWKEVGPHVLHMVKSYAEFSAGGVASSSPFVGATVTMEAVRRSGTYRVVTPDEAIELAAKADELNAEISLMPLIGGLSPKVAWKNLELLIEKVLPRIKGRTVESISLDSNGFGGSNATVA